jgi:hypothetical protein
MSATHSRSLLLIGSHSSPGEKHFGLLDPEFDVPLPAVPIAPPHVESPGGKSVTSFEVRNEWIGALK